jgi:hypothetical protein
MISKFCGIPLGTDEHALVVKEDRQGMTAFQLIFAERDSHIGSMCVIRSQIYEEWVAVSREGWVDDAANDQGKGQYHSQKELHGSLPSMG